MRLEECELERLHLVSICVRRVLSQYSFSLIEIFEFVVDFVAAVACSCVHFFVFFFFACFLDLLLRRPRRIPQEAPTYFSNSNSSILVGVTTSETRASPSWYEFYHNLTYPSKPLPSIRNNLDRTGSCDARGKFKKKKKGLPASLSISNLFSL